MIRILLTVAVLGSMGSFAGPAMAQDKQGETFNNNVSSALSKLDAQCAHRRVTAPDPRDGCAQRARNDAQLGYGQVGATELIGPAGPGRGNGNAKGGGKGGGNSQ